MRLKNIINVYNNNTVIVTDHVPQILEENVYIFHSLVNLYNYIVINKCYQSILLIPLYCLSGITLVLLLFYYDLYFRSTCSMDACIKILGQ